MAKRQSKAKQILYDAAVRIEAAKTRKRSAQHQLDTATATLDALQDAYDALEKALAPTPRKKTAKPPPTQEPLRIVADKEDEGPKCGVCANTADFVDHFKPSPHYHPFVSSVPSAGKKSRQKTAGASSAANSVIDSGIVLDVGVSAGD